MSEKVKALQTALKESGKNVTLTTKESEKVAKQLAKATAAHEKIEAKLAKLTGPTE